MPQIARLKRFLSFTFDITQRSHEKMMCIYLLFDWLSGGNCIVFTFPLHKGQIDFHRLKETMMEQSFF